MADYKARNRAKLDTYNNIMNLISGTNISEQISAAKVIGRNYVIIDDKILNTAFRRHGLNITHLIYHYNPNFKGTISDTLSNNFPPEYQVKLSESGCMRITYKLYITWDDIPLWDQIMHL